MDLDACQNTDRSPKRIRLSPEVLPPPPAMSDSIMEEDNDDLYDSPVKPGATVLEQARAAVSAESETSRDTTNHVGQVPGLNLAADSSSMQVSTYTPIRGEEIPMDASNITLPGLVEQEKTVATQDTNPPASLVQAIPGTSGTEGIKAAEKPSDEGTRDMDTGFVEAAVANRSNQAAEWQYDSSNDDTSDTSSDSSDEDSDDSSDDDDFHKLNLEEQARILMQGEGGSDDEGGRGPKASAKSTLRTTNEKPDEITKPDVTVTEDMEIQELGLVENIVESFVLIKGKVSGETRVLESGSVLCLEDRTVIGSVAEPIGRVDQPFYSVAFTDAESIKESHIEQGTKVFYVVSHSTYVFTQPLKAFKGSDASNQHDEEVAPDEIEFSDDEAEAEYKRSLKQEKLARRNANINARTGPSTTDDLVRTATEHEYPSQAMNYDDGDAEEELYTPLARPDNFHVLARPDQSSRGNRDARGNSHRGRGGGRQLDRGRGGRGGRGRSGNRPQRDGRGGRSSGPDNMRGRGQQRGHQSMQMRPSHPQSPESHNITHPYASNSQMPPHFSSYSNNAPAMPQQQWPPPAYAGQGQAYGIPQSPVSPVPPFSPGGSIPAGAFINPAFFRGQQPHSPAPYNASTYTPHSNMPEPAHPSPYPNQQYAGYPNVVQASHDSWGSRHEGVGSPTTPGSAMAFQQAQEKLNLLRQLSHHPGSS